MAKMIQVGSNFGGKIAKALGLPDKVIWFELRCAVDEIVSVKAEMFVETDAGELETVLREFDVHLVEKNG